MSEPTSTSSFLKGEVTRLNKECAGWRVKYKETKGEVQRLTTSLTEATGKLTGLEKQVGKPSDLQAQIDDLKGENRQLKHSAKFRELASAAGIVPEAIDDAWGALKLKADADEPDEAALTAALEAAKASKAYLFKAADAASGKEPAQAEVKPPPPAFGTGRGKEAAPAGYVLTREQRGDPKFMVENDRAIKEAQAAGTLVYKD